MIGRTFSILFLIGAAWMITRPTQVLAQKLADSTEHQANKILDDPGVPTYDPDDTWEYLDGLSSLSVSGLDALHANPNLSWIIAHRVVRGFDSTSLSNFDESQSNANDHSFALRGRVSQSLEAYSQEGYTSHQYLGPPEAVYNRIRAQSSEIGVTALEEKLAWEPSFTDRLKGFAYLRKPTEITNSISIKQAVAGDYGLAFGNGLVFGGGVSGSKTFAAADAVEQRSFGMRGTITNGAKSLEGGAMELGIGPTNLMLFASRRAIDARVDSNDSIQTLYPTGYHQTQSELAFEDAAALSVVGARVEIETSDTAAIYLRSGATAYELHYNHPLSETTNQFFIGSTLSMVGVDALAIGNNFSATMDAAISNHDTTRNAAAFSVSGLFEADSDVGLSLMYRHIPNSFVSPYGEVSGQGISSLSNEDGFYAGVQMSAFSKRLRISAYADIENELAPISDIFVKQKNDYLAAARFKATDALELSATVRDNWNSNPPEDSSTLTGAQNASGQTMNIRFEAQYDPKQSASLKTRYEVVRYTSVDLVRTGWLALEEVRFKIKPIHSELTVSAGRFETDSYNSSVWTYEPGVWGTGTNNALDAKGWRVNIRTNIRAWTRFACSFSLSGSFYDSPRTFGSGVSARMGSSDLNGAIQLDLSL